MPSFSQIMATIFDFDPYGWKVILLSIVPALINIGIFLYGTFRLPQKSINTVFLVFVLFLGCGQIAQGAIQMSANEQAAIQWSRISQSIWTFIPPLGLFFTLKFTGLNKKISYGLLFILLFFPTFFLELALIADPEHNPVVKSGHWGWVINPASSTVTSAIYAWISCVAAIALLLLWVHFYREKKESNKRYQALLLAVGISVPFVGGMILEIMFPLIFKFDSIPLTTPLITVFSLFAIVAIAKFSMLDYSPRHQWRTIIDTMNEGVLIVNNSGKIMYANPTFCRIVEYDLNEIKGKAAGRLFLAEPDGEFFLGKGSSGAEMNADQYEKRLRTKGGNMIWVSMNTSPYLDRRGNIVGSIGVLTNITHKKELEKNLRDNNSRLNSAQAIAHVGSWELNIATGLSVWSDEALSIYGLSPEEKIQTPDTWISLIHPDDRSRVKKQVESSMVNLTDCSFEHRIVQPNGTVRHLHSISRFEFDASGAPIVLFGVCHDITERKENEKKLNELSERLVLATESARIGIFDWDLVTGELIWDLNMFSLYHSSPGDGDPREIVRKAIVPEDKDRLDREVSAAMLRNKDFHTIFCISVGPEKELRYLEARGVIMRNADGTPVRMIGVNWDFTHQKISEEKIRQSEIRIRSFAKHLHKLQEEERAHLAREIHDELGQQLVGIKFELSSIMNSSESSSVRSKVGNALINVDELIQSLRKIATELRPGIIDTLGLGPSIEWLSKEFGRKTGIVPEVEIGIVGHKYDKCISICYFRVCQEALTNISKHSGADKIKISIVQKNENLTLIISDNGKGMSSDILKNPFSMGLLGMRERAESISGDLQIKSRKGQGTVIQFKAIAKYEKDLNRGRSSSYQERGEVNIGK